MEVCVTPEMQAKLAHLAAQEGRNTNELVQDTFSRYLEEQARIIEAIRLGEDALQRGEYLTHEEVGERLGRLFES
jgi:predicted transcriptional regulator